MMKKLLKLAAFLPLSAALVTLAAIELRAAPDDGFGRLFSRPAERRSLDTLRQNQQLKLANPQRDATPNPAAVAEPEPVTMQGYVKRSDGAATVWINRKPIRENSIADDVEIGRLSRPAHSAEKGGTDSLGIRIPATGKRIRLKAGQVYEPETGRIIELKLLEKEKQLDAEPAGVTAHEAAP